MTTTRPRRKESKAIQTILVVLAASVLLVCVGSESVKVARDEAADRSAQQRMEVPLRNGRLPAEIVRHRDVPRPREEERTLPEGWEKTVRSWSPDSVTMRVPTPGEEAPVRAHRFVPGQQPPQGPPPNPLVPPKIHLSEEDLRAGLGPE